MNGASRQQKFSIGYSIAALLALFLLHSVLFAPHAETVSYSEFKALVKQGKVSHLVLDKQTIRGTLVTEGLERLLSPEKVEALKRAGGETHQFTTARSALFSWLLPAVVFGGV